jgi:hypothetical protein
LPFSSVRIFQVIEWYQPGRSKIPVMATDDYYYCATRDGESPPKGWPWQKQGEAYRYQIHRASVQEVQ